MTKIVVLVHCDTVIYNQQQNSKLLPKFVLNKSSGQLLDVSPKKFSFSKKINLELSNSLEVED